MLRDASQRAWAVEAPELASRCEAPQHEGEGAQRIFGQTNQPSFSPNEANAFWPNGAQQWRGEKNQPAAVGNDRRLPFPVSGLFFTGTCATRACEPPDARTPAFVIAGHSASKTRVNALMTRQSIDLRKDFLQKRWMRGSSPRMTS
jgi:hypothetical protein